jgi:hypothetical protein
LVVEADSVDERAFECGNDKTRKRGSDWYKQQRPRPRAFEREGQLVRAQGEADREKRQCNLDEPKCLLFGHFRRILGRFARRLRNFTRSWHSGCFIGPGG